MKVPLLDLKAQYAAIRAEVEGALEEVLQSQHFILGPKVKELEEKIAEYCGCRYAVGVSSGTDAILISLMTAGIGHGDLVITTPFTFFATAGAIARVGAEPLFVDIEEKTYNMDPGELEKTVLNLGHSERRRLKAVVPIHLFGQIAEMEPILELAARHELILIEDAAQAIGAEYAFSNGEIRRAGSMGQFGCFSFFPSKNLGAFGDGGMVTTNSSEIYERLEVMRVHGSKPKYHHQVIGGNFRLDALQAAVLAVKLDHLDAWTDSRRQNAADYRKLFSEAALDEVLPPLDRAHRHIYNQFVIKVRDGRDELKRYLQEKGIGCEIYYPLPLHMQACFNYLAYRPEDFPVSLEASRTSLAIPVFPELEIDQQIYVVDMLKDFFEG